MWKPAPYRSVKEIIHFLVVHPFKTESEIQEQVFGYRRGIDFESNKKYADMLRRGLSKGLIKRISWRRKDDTRNLYFYYVPSSANINM